jgi:hypothetical protein
VCSNKVPLSSHSLFGFHHFSGMTLPLSLANRELMELDRRIRQLEGRLGTLVRERYQCAQTHYALAFGWRRSEENSGRRADALVSRLEAFSSRIRLVDCALEVERAEYRRLLALIFSPAEQAVLPAG